MAGAKTKKKDKKKEARKKSGKGNCGVCYKSLNKHSDDDLMECLTSFALVQNGEKPTDKIVDAVTVSQRLKKSPRIQQDMSASEFVVTLDGVEKKTDKPAKAIVKLLLDHYDG